MRSFNSSRYRSLGLSIVELLVALGLSLLLIAGVITMFTSTRGTYEINDRVARLQENGRFALESIARDVRAAGYKGCAGDDSYPGGSFVNTVNPVAGNLTAGNAALTLPEPVEAFEYTGAYTWNPVLNTGWVVNPAGAVDSDVILIRRPRPDMQSIALSASMNNPAAALNTAPVAAGAPQLIQVGQILMIANCVSRALFAVTAYNPATGVIQHQAIAPNANTLGNQNASLGDRFGSDADADTNPNSTTNNKGPGTLTAQQTVIYYLRDSTAGNGTSLWRRMDGNPPEEVVEGIDALQILYGVGTDDEATQYVTADAIPAGTKVISVSIALLVRSLEEYGTIEADDQTYNLLGKNFVAPGDHRLRQIFSTTIALRNIAK